MVDLWVLHIDSLRRTFDQSLMKIFQRVQEIWSRQESVMEGWTDGQMKAISIIPHLRRGINNFGKVHQVKLHTKYQRPGLLVSALVT